MSLVSKPDVIMLCTSAANVFIWRDVGVVFGDTNGQAETMVTYNAYYVSDDGMVFESNAERARKAACDVVEQARNKAVHGSFEPDFIELEDAADHLEDW